jgi:hypothetical protein
MRTEPYQFAFHNRVATTPPKGGSMVEVFNRLKNGEKLSRSEKNDVFHQLQGNGPIYRVAGWAFPFMQFMKRYLVKSMYNNHWEEIWAFDKTCIRSSFYTKEAIQEIIEAPVK